MSRRRYLAGVVGLCLVVLAATSCGGGESAAAPRTTAPPASIELPTQLLGLKVEPENIRSKLQQRGQPFVDSVGLFAFRRGKDLLEATLQASRFTPDARPESTGFRGSIISRIGGTSPRTVRVERQNVYLTSGKNQVVFIWFKKRGFFVLTVRRDYAFPRTLVRKLVDLGLEV